MVSPATKKRKLPEPGDVVAGKYRFVRRLGEGGMGVVYEAEHTRIQQRVAIKMLLPEVVGRPDVVSRFEREARAAGKLKNEHTARVLDVDVTDAGLPYMVMEFLDGSDLADMLVKRGPLPVPQAVDLVLQTCDAMAEAHSKGVIHRDLKPSNLFLVGDGATSRVKVLDFGISKLQNDEESRVTATQTAIGTPLYMSPEQIRSAKHVDTRTDIWSLGVILYELLAGRTPFEGSTTAAAAAICIDSPPPLAQFRSDVPRELEKAMLKALEKDPTARFQTVHELAVAIEPFGTGRLPPFEATAPAIAVPPTLMPARVQMESARTLPQDPSDSAAVPRVAGGATLPGWTTRATSGTRRARTFVAALIGALAVALVTGYAVRHSIRASHATEDPHPNASVAAPSPPPPATTTTVSTEEPVPSTTVSAEPTLPEPRTTKPPRAHPTAHPHPPATTVIPTATHTAAPAPTRL